MFPKPQRLEALKLAIARGGDVNAVADFGDVPLVEEPGSSCCGAIRDFDSEPPRQLARRHALGRKSAIHGLPLRRPAFDHSAAARSRSEARCQDEAWMDAVDELQKICSSPRKEELAANCQFLRRLMRRTQYGP